MSIYKAEALQRVGPLVELPAVLRSFGIDPAAVLARAGLAPDALDDPAGMIELPTVGAVLAAGAEATACPHFGLMVGSRARPDHFGPVGNLLRNAPTLGTAMMDLAAYQHRYIRGRAFHLLAREESCMLIYSVFSIEVTDLDQIVDAVMASLFVVFRAISGVVPCEVRLARSTPERREPYVALFGWPQYNAPVTGLGFFVRDLAAPVPAANSELRSELEAAIETYWGGKQPNVATRATQAIAARLCTGDASKPAIAAALAMHPRTLGRRLIDEGTSFRELARQMQLQVASQLLSGTCLTVAGIARTLGYSSPAAFVKAFRRDTGISPGARRVQARQQHDAAAKLSP